MHDPTNCNPQHPQRIHRATRSDQHPHDRHARSSAVAPAVLPPTARPIRAGPGSNDTGDVIPSTPRATRRAPTRHQPMTNSCTNHHANGPLPNPKRMEDGIRAVSVSLPRCIGPTRKTLEVLPGE